MGLRNWFDFSWFKLFQVPTWSLKYLFPNLDLDEVIHSWDLNSKETFQSILMNIMMALM